MDTTCDNFHAGRKAMLDAFLSLSTLARQAGCDPEAITDIHGQFFDGNVAVKSAFRTAVILARIRSERTPPPR